jgi:hypothetical protein
MAKEEPGAPARAPRHGIGYRVRGSDTTLARQRVANFRQLQRRRWVERIYELGGSRLFDELFDELIRHRLVAATALDERLARFAAADPDRLHATGGDRPIPRPIWAIRGRR